MRPELRPWQLRRLEAGRCGAVKTTQLITAAEGVEV